VTAAHRARLPTVLKLLSWNVAGRSSLMPQQVDAVSRREPDLVCLQEVREGRLSHWIEALRDDGLEHVADSSELLSGRVNQTLIASRWELTPLPAIPGPQPERVLSVVIESPWGQLEVHNAHVPNGSTYGLIKVATFESIYERLARPNGRHRILAGDLNAPQAETTAGEVVTFANRHPEHGERWDAAERSVLTGLAEWDLPDLYRQLHGYAVHEVTWERATRNGSTGRRFDHVFASASLNGAACDYVHGWRPELSDHSAVEAVFEPADP
jgi:exonuclease III